VEGEGARLNIPRTKKRQEGARVPLTVEELATAEASEQRRSAPDTDDNAVGTSAREARRLRGLDVPSGRQHAVPTAPLRRASGAARQPRGDGAPTGGPGAGNGG
jgi:hypothetical protein